MTEKKETVFAQGMFFNKPHENAPDFVKGRMNFKVEEFVPFLQKHVNSKGYVNVDLLKSKKGTLYLALNTFESNGEKLEQAKADDAKTIEYPSEDSISIDDIPF